MSESLKCLMIDNFDSFTYNIVQYLQMLRVDVNVVRNDHDVSAALDKLKPHFMVISPGPSHPKDSPGSLQAIDAAIQRKLPLLGVCLGHQCIGAYFGGEVCQAPTPVHGKPAQVKHNGHKLFSNIPSPFQVARYHSLVINRDCLPQELEVTSELSDGLIMSVAHRSLAITGVQFHPESIISRHGLELLKNFIDGYVTKR